MTIDCRNNSNAVGLGDGVAQSGPGEGRDRRIREQIMRRDGMPFDVIGPRTPTSGSPPSNSRSLWRAISSPRYGQPVESVECKEKHAPSLRAGQVAALTAINALLGIAAHHVIQRYSSDRCFMTITGIATLDHAPQVFAEWLNELCDDLEFPKPRAYMLLHETLHAIRDFLTVDEAADLAAQLPVLVRGVYFEGWNPSKTPAKPRGKSDLIARVASRFQKEPLDEPDRAVAAVIDLLRRHVSWGEFEQVKHAMRKPVQELWE
ncbi:DUF2267 domain-containing protein [Celeribacter baekdonensis]|uniref:DUF2267 domain-containing protein n=1 Tax=Celeribacter baekdonensis B30 TaxID=1208323 RepID=K2JIW0_9RHOB|nr:DUF2267 domain-containing protein [Celeribacter baekdonensis]EKE74412.1 hypothetical protein B30_01760 [Celeribacter baekdonensis B30]